MEQPARLISFFRLLGALLFTITITALMLWTLFLPYSVRVRWIKPLGVKWAKILLKHILRLKVIVDLNGLNPEPKPGYMTISNHLSFLDIPVITTYLQKMFLMKSEIYWTPFGLGARMCGALSIKRNKLADQLRGAKQLINVSKNIQAMHLFPEGTRSNGELLPLKRGALHRAFEAKLPVMVFAIWGSHLVLPKHSILLQPAHTIVLQGGAMINCEDYSDFESFFDKIKEELHKAYSLAKQRAKE